MKRFYVGLLLMSLFSLASGSAEAIDGGAPARAGDRLGRATVGVGTLVAGGDRIGFNRCTGVLVAADLVLTAAHCVRDNPLASAVILFDGARPVGPAIPVAALARYDVPGDLPAEYAGLLALSLDTAILRLTTPVRGRAPIGLRGGGLPPSGLRLAGSGLSPDGVGTLRITRLDPLLLTSTGLLIARTRGSEVCTGDSGGPVIADGPRGPILWGVASAVLTSRPPCGGVVIIAPAPPRS